MNNILKDRAGQVSTIRVVAALLLFPGIIIAIILGLSLFFFDIPRYSQVFSVCRLFIYTGCILVGMTALEKFSPYN